MRVCVFGIPRWSVRHVLYARGESPNQLVSGAPDTVFRYEVAPYSIIILGALLSFWIHCY